MRGEVYNINADIAAARIAAELGALKLILMTDIRGLLRRIRTTRTRLIPGRQRERACRRLQRIRASSPAA